MCVVGQALFLTDYYQLDEPASEKERQGDRNRQWETQTDRQTERSGGKSENELDKISSVD